MARYKVPQNIDMQDRIIGPLTMYQFFYLLAAGMIGYTALRSGIVIFIFVGLPIVLLALALSFIKINDQPFAHFIKSFLIFILASKTRVWHKQASAINVTIDKPEKIKETVPPKIISRKAITDLAKKLDK